MLMEGDNDKNEYFSSYEDVEVHKLMLEDGPRTEAYRAAILGNKEYFKEKTVMDVGCGTGILSIFCAQAGAKKVYAVEASKLANLAKEIIKENNLQDVIEVIHSKVEDVCLPDTLKVDAIVSEWMGFYLLHEGMLDSVIWARDKFLKKGGEVFPETAAIYCSPCSVPSMYQKWDEIYGVSMKTFANQLRVSKGHKPDIMTVQSDDILAEEETMCWINLREDSISDLDTFDLNYIKGVSKTGVYQGICLWFEVNFPNLSDNIDSSRVILSTAPSSAPTHWKQTVIVLPHQQEVEEGEPLAFQLSMTRDQESYRRYNLQVTMLDPDEVEHPLPCTCHMTKCILIKTLLAQQTNNIIEDMSNDINSDDES